MIMRRRYYLTGLVLAAYVLGLLSCALPGQEDAGDAQPTVNIVSPTAGTQVTAGETVPVQVMAVDTRGHDQAQHGITRVELWVDNALLEAQDLPQPVATYQSVFDWVVNVAPGSHALLVRAYNEAGVASNPVVISVLVVQTGASGIVPSPALPTTSTVVPLPTSSMPTTTASSPPPPTATATTRPTAGQPTPTNTKTVSALTGKIAFPVLNEDGVHYDTWVVNADGSNARRVAVKLRQPCFRPDGAEIAVNGEAHYQDHLIVMNADGSNQHEVSKHVEDSHPSWSPDGNRLVYDTTAAPGGGWQICVVDDLATKSWHALSGPGGAFGGLRGQYPTWMPDGRIVFKTADYWATDTQGGLHVVGDGGGMPTRITSSSQDTAPAVHGNTVVFMSNRQGDDYEVWSARVSGGLDAGLKQLTDNGAQDGLPAWSPDGQHIAFVSDQGGNWGLWVMRADGSGRRKILDLPGTLGGDWGNERVSWAR